MGNPELNAKLAIYYINSWQAKCATTKWGSDVCKSKQLKI